MKIDGRTVMTQLWFASGEQCRKACDVLGIDRRRVRTLGRRYSEEHFHYGSDIIDGKWVDGIPLTHTIRFNADLMDKAEAQFSGQRKREQLIAALGHLDDEDSW